MNSQIYTIQDVIILSSISMPLSYLELVVLTLNDEKIYQNVHIT